MIKKERDFVLPENETMLFDDLRFYYHTKNVWGLMLYIKKLIAVLGHDLGASKN